LPGEADSLNEFVDIQTVPIGVADGASSDVLGQHCPLVIARSSGRRECPLTAPNFDESLAFQFLVSLAHRIWIKAELASELSHGWERVASHQRPVNESSAYLINDLEVQGLGIRWVKYDVHGVFLCPSSPVH
jgi:hypothetical protein